MKNKEFRYIIEAEYENTLIFYSLDQEQLFKDYSTTNGGNC